MEEEEVVMRGNVLGGSYIPHYNERYYELSWCFQKWLFAAHPGESISMLAVTVGFTEDLRAPRAATPPRLALSGAVVLNAGHEHSQVPAAQWTARTQPRCTETADGSPPRMNTL
ncbi:hypothetical protein EYF80_021788 [Liparis tanakae]|uniref:Uncharacterized protein n=1 Tax=Liparis tanakae TaxID=230148 RepID=A0A4Z2HQ83_9TELE|nr:hypothetical protein EYF80_021788 [Liparis tanakae]